MSHGARPGETIQIALGYYANLKKEALTVQIVAANGASYTYSPGDARIRFVLNSYPDPLSGLIVQDRARPTEIAIAGMIRDQYTSGDDEFLQTIAFIDLPNDIPPGVATIRFYANGVALGVYHHETEVLAGPAATSLTFRFQANNGGAPPMDIESLARVPHFSVSLSSADTVVPHSVEIVFARTLGSSGLPWVTQGRGDTKNIMWSDTGSELRVLLTPVNGLPVADLKRLRFYVTGAVETLQVTSLKAYDTAGNPLSGFTAVVEHVD